MELTFICPKCGATEVVDYTPGVFDLILFDEPRFPGNTVFSCSECSKFSKVSSGILVKVSHMGVLFPIKVKTDEYEMKFLIRPMWTQDPKEFDISRFEEVVGRFVKDGSVPD